MCFLQTISRQFGSLVRLVKEHQDQYEDNNSPLNKKLVDYSRQGELQCGDPCVASKPNKTVDHY